MSPEGYLPQLDLGGKTVLWECDADLRYVSVSPQVEHVLGYPAEALVGEPLLQHVTPEAEGRWGDALATRVALSGVEVIHLNRDGRFVYLRADAEPLRDTDFTGYRGAYYDETHQRGLLARLRQLTALVENSAVFFGLADLNGSAIFLNDPGAKMVGLESPADIAGKSINDFLLPEAIDQHMSEIYPALLKHGVWSGQHTFQDFRTGEPIPIDANSFVVRDPETEQPVAIAMIARDLRSEREQERARLELEEKLRQAQKMESLGRLAGGIAHDFNNLLTPILGNLELASRDVDLSPRTRRLLDGAHEAATRTAGVTRQILAFGHKQVLRLEPVDLSALVEQTTPLLQDSAKPGELSITIAPDLWVKADADQLVQVLVNLVINARDALEEPSAILLQISSQRLNDGEVSPLPGGEYALIEVRDEGVGIRPEVLANIFDPFFSTKQRGEGTGLGLASVHGIVEQHGGRVAVESTHGQGATFRVFLQTCPRPTPAPIAPTPVEPGPATRSGKRLLLLEDDLRVREFIAALLASEGYDVVAADTLEGARALLSPDLDLILSDVILPDGRGPDLLVDFEAAGLDLPVVFMSGFQDHESVVALGQPGRHYLPKPFRPAELLTKLRAALNQR